MRTFLLNVSKRMEHVSAKQRLVLVALVLILGSMVSGDFIGEARLKEMTGGIGMLDMERWYTPAKAYATIEALGSAGREFYVWLSLLDLAVILSLGLMQSAFITFLFQKLSVPEKWLRLNLLPYARGLFDVLENCTLLFIACQYPRTFIRIAWIAGLFTMVKWIFMTISMGIILLALIGWGWKTISQRINVARAFEIEGNV